MSEAKFTKGDWKVNSLVNGRGFDISFNDDGECIAEIIHIESDAHLIAAAPEMYAMLDMLVDNDGINDCSIDREVESLLAKARGES